MKTMASMIIAKRKYFYFKSWDQISGIGVKRKKAGPKAKIWINLYNSTKMAGSD